jgi:hypothetical protein
LKACKHALEHGVRRVRILPVSSIESLQLFYFSRIEHGTEVVKATEIIKAINDPIAVRQTAAV